MKTKFGLIISSISILLISACADSKQESIVSEIEIIPTPVTLVKGEGSFTVNENTVLMLNIEEQELKNLVDFLSQAIYKGKGFFPEIIVNSTFDNQSNYIGFKLVPNDKLNGEEYTLNVDREKVVIQASKTVGLFYGLQTLLQLMPAEIYGDEKSANIK